MTIEEVMKDIELDVRLTYGYRWLAWTYQWVVYRHLARNRHTDCLYAGDDLSKALTILVEEET